MENLPEFENVSVPEIAFFNENVPIYVLLIASISSAGTCLEKLELTS